MRTGGDDGRKIEFRPSGPILIFSPHLDDAVLSCTGLLRANPGTTVVTVLAGAPDTHHTGYNSRTTGAAFAPDALRIRRDEDAAALSTMAAEFVWLDFIDNDYLDVDRRDNDVAEIRDAIVRVIELHRPATVMSPLGLVHPDHVRVSDVCLEVARTSSVNWYLYTDLPYATSMPRSLDQRITDLKRVLTLGAPMLVHGDANLKRETMKIYRTQYEPTRKSNRRGFRAAMKEPEQYRRVGRDRAI